MDENMEMQEGITFSEIFALMKKGWQRILIYVLIAVILSTAVLVVLRATISSVEYATKVTFTTTSIKEKDNWIPSKNIDSIVKSDAVINAALAKCGFSDEEIVKLQEKGFKSSVSTYVEESMTDAEKNSYPSIVRISIKRKGSYGLSKSQYNSIVEALTDVALSTIKSKYAVEVTMGDIELDFNEMNYLQAYATLRDFINEYKTYLNNCDSELLAFKSTESKESVAELKSKVSSLENQLSVIESYLVNKKVANNKTSISISELNYVKLKVTNLTQEKTVLSTRITETASLLEKVKPVINNYASGDVSISNESYYEYLETYNELQDEYKEINLELVTWTNMETAYTASTDNSEEANTLIQGLFNEVVEKYKNSLTSLKATVQEYNETSLLNSAVYESDSVSTVMGDEISVILILAVDVVVIVIMLIIALAVTRKQEKAKEAKENKEVLEAK